MGDEKEAILATYESFRFPKGCNFSAEAAKMRLECVSACLCQSRPIDPGLPCQEITRVTETCYFSSLGFPETASGAYEIRTQFFISGIGDL